MIIIILIFVFIFICMFIQVYCYLYVLLFYLYLLLVSRYCIIVFMYYYNLSLLLSHYFNIVQYRCLFLFVFIIITIYYYYHDIYLDYIFSILFDHVCGSSPLLAHYAPIMAVRSTVSRSSCKNKNKRIARSSSAMAWPFPHATAHCRGSACPA